MSILRGSETSNPWSHRHDVITTVDVDDLAGDSRREWGGEERRGVADLLERDIPPQRGLLRRTLQHPREASDPTGGKRVHGTRGNPVHPDPPRAEIGGKIAHGRLERGLGGAHDV